MSLSERVPVTALLGTSMFFSGASYAATMPYASLVGVETLGLSGAWFGMVMGIGAVLGTLVSLSLGYVSDKLRDRRLLVILTALAGMTGHGMIYLWPTQLSFAIAMAVVMPFAFACFSQSLAYVRVYYLQRMPHRADFMVTALRTVFTISWIIVPPAAGWIAEMSSIFNVYLASSLSYAIIGVVFAILLGNPRAQVQTPPAIREPGASIFSALALPKHTLAGLAGLIIMSSGTRVMSFILPLFIVRDLGGDTREVGYYSGITAAIEAPCMLFWAWLTTRLSKETLIVCAGMVMALFMFGASLMQSVPALYWLLILNGFGIAALMSIPISYTQDAIKGRVGLSTSLLDITAIAANLLGAAAFAVLTAGDDYRFALVIAAGITVVGAMTMALGNLDRLGRLNRAPA